MNTTYEITHRPATPEEYVRLCTRVGWEPYMPLDLAPEALARSLYGVTVHFEGEAVAMGRVVGDGVIYFYLQDIAVTPEHQGRGAGALVVDALVDWLTVNAAPGACIGLFASGGKEGFYERWDFRAHDGMTGMFQVAPVARREVV